MRTTHTPRPRRSWLDQMRFHPGICMTLKVTPLDIGHSLQASMALQPPAIAAAGRSIVGA
jgi:hypothetical protein